MCLLLLTFANNRLSKNVFPVPPGASRKYVYIAVACDFVRVEEYFCLSTYVLPRISRNLKSKLEDFQFLNSTAMIFSCYLSKTSL